MDKFIFSTNSIAAPKKMYQFAVIDSNARDVGIFETLLRIEGNLDFSLKIWHEFRPALDYFYDLNDNKEFTPPDVIFIDFSGLGVNEISAYKLLRQIKILSNTHIIVHSSTKHMHLMQNFKNDNATVFLKKPIDTGMFLKFLET